MTKKNYEDLKTWVQATYTSTFLIGSLYWITLDAFGFKCRELEIVLYITGFLTITKHLYCGIRKLKRGGKRRCSK